MNARTANGTLIAITTPTTARWTDTGTPSATMATPTSAPPTVPKLNPAWKRDMIARPIRCSTSAPWTFMATSQLAIADPVTTRAMTTGTTPTSTPSAAPISPHPPTALPIITTRREPNRWMSGPDSGSPTTDPTAIANSTKPSPAALRSSWSLTCGIREAQFANANPLATNAA